MNFELLPAGFFMLKTVTAALIQQQSNTPCISWPRCMESINAIQLDVYITCMYAGYIGTDQNNEEHPTCTHLHKIQTVSTSIYAGIVSQAPMYQ